MEPKLKEGAGIKRRTLEDRKTMNPAQRTGESDQSASPNAILEAYKKHVEELRGIEDRQQKSIALILGILSAAGTLLIKEGGLLDPVPKLYVSLLALIVVGIGQHAINELHDLRIATRDLLVRCEIALRFYEAGAFLKGRMLYTNYELDYPARGAWMKQNYWIVWIVCAGFLILLWFGKSIVTVIHLPG